jgi:hypothetical protein
VRLRRRATHRRGRLRSRTAHRLALGLVFLLASGCFRAVYTNLEPPDPYFVPRTPGPRSSSWRSFYLYGYLPSELVVDAGAECGGATRVREIRTRQTFTQGLIRMFATSSGVNAYAPWTAEVLCVDDPGG